MDDFYRENILDHYRNPRNSGHLEHPRTAEGVNPLCGDELSVELSVEDGVVRDVRFNGRGCAISQAAASMISDVVKGKTVDEVAALGSEDVLEELGIPLTPIRLKCALLSVSVLKVASPSGDAPGRPTATRSSGNPRRPRRGRSPRAGSRSSSRARCSSGSTGSTASCTRSRTAAATTTARSARASGRGSSVVCPRHGARFDLRTGAVLSLPATEDVEAFPVEVRDGEVYVVA